MLDTLSVCLLISIRNMLWNIIKVILISVSNITLTAEAAPVCLVCSIFLWGRLSFHPLCIKLSYYVHVFEFNVSWMRWYAQYWTYLIIIYQLFIHLLITIFYFFRIIDNINPTNFQLNKICFSERKANVFGFIYLTHVRAIILADIDFGVCNFLFDGSLYEVFPSRRIRCVRASLHDNYYNTQTAVRRF